MRCRFTLWLIISSLQFTFSQVNYIVIPKLGIANPLSSSFQSDDEFFEINALNISPTAGLSLGFITSKGLCFNLLRLSRDLRVTEAFQNVIVT